MSCSDWSLDVNEIDPRVFAEMLNHIVLPRDVAFASKCTFLQLMENFPAALMQVRRCFNIVSFWKTMLYGQEVLF